MKKSFRRIQKAQRRRRFNFGSYPGPVETEPVPPTRVATSRPEPEPAVEKLAESVR